MQMKNISSHATRPSLVALSPVVVVERRVRAIDGDVARDPDRGLDVAGHKYIRGVIVHTVVAS